MSYIITTIVTMLATTLVVGLANRFSKDSLERELAEMEQEMSKFKRLYFDFLKGNREG